MTPRERGFAYCAIHAYTGLLYVGIVPLFSDFRDKVRNMDLQAGLYRHYKGQNYRVLGVARHSETEEALVIYQALYGEFGLWVRPLEMFTEAVEVDGEWVPRFVLVSPEADPLGLQKAPGGEDRA
ncbi:DUF1653 domain-containing protein [Pseudomonas aeruginosa]|nr:DUF1653 domain-containing protein [Pseudomonas aeruginosa]